MASKGIDYGMGNTNRDPETGIRFGVIGMNSENLSEWAWESTEADYGDPHCPKCGGDAVEYDDERHGHYDEGGRHGGGCCEYACEACEVWYDTAECYGEEAVGHTLEEDGYTGRVDEMGDMFVTKSPYYTRAQFCSPCAPGACHLDHPMPEGEKCYCLGHDWFRGGRAPYPVYSVESDALVMPEWSYNFTGPDDQRHIRTWSFEGFVVEMYDTGKRDDRGTTNIAFRLTDRGEVIFQDDEFHPSPLYSDDGDDCLAALLGFLSLKKGDTDSEYFRNYTPRQLEWSWERAEELCMLGMELEESANATTFVMEDGTVLEKGEDSEGNMVWTNGDLTFSPNAVGRPVWDDGNWIDGEFKR